MSNFYTTYEIADAIPLNDYGYVITPDGKIHSLRYKFSHSYVICLLFKKYLPDFNLDINDLDFDSATYSNVVNKFVSYMPTIQISRIKSDFIYHYNFWFDTKLVNAKMIESYKHIIYNVYGCDGSEYCDYKSPNDKVSGITNILNSM